MTEDERKRILIISLVTLFIFWFGIVVYAFINQYYL